MASAPRQASDSAVRDGGSGGIENCRQMRRKIVTYSTMNFGTGTISNTRQEWVTEACSAPLFDTRSKVIGRCPSCEGGWKSETNFPVEQVEAPVAHGTETCAVEALKPV